MPPRRRPDEETLSAVLGGRAHRDTEIGTDGVSLIVRAIPLRPRGEHAGALVLVRDVTDLRRRDRELVTKDATIREIHHRVKNNLQTVAALLRLQARRMDSESARLALEEAVRRVGTIAIVHETLSQAVEEHVDFDEIADRLGRMVTEVSAVGSRVRVSRDGDFGVLLVRDGHGARHGADRGAAERRRARLRPRRRVRDGSRSGSIVVRVRRPRGRLHLSVDDDGRGSAAPGSTSTGRPAWDCPSSGRWWSPSSGVGSSSAPRREAPGRGRRWTSPSP